MSSPASAGSSFSFGQDSNQRSDASDDFLFPARPKIDNPAGSIQIPFEVVVVCRRSDVLLHPGGYRLTASAMQDQGGGNDGLLAKEIRAIVRKRALVDPMIRPKPAIRFLVEADGSDTFWLARRQLFFALPDWPMSLQASTAQIPPVFNKGTW
jgi:hypothetical protein